MGVAALIYLEMAGFVDARVAVVYLLIWAILFRRLNRLPMPFGALFQTPVYGWLIWVLLQQALQARVWLVAQVVGYVGFAWRYLAPQGLPEFLQGSQAGRTRLLPCTGHRGGENRDHTAGTASECSESPPVDRQLLEGGGRSPGAS
jgi:hypothetical protein